MRHSENLNELAAALAKAQGAMEGASKSAVNPHFKSKYADLASVWEAIREPLAKNGLSVIQLPDMDESGQIRVTTMLIHSSGQFIEASYALPPMKNDAQGYGSAITYMKRYALTGMGVAPEDDDGHAATKAASDEPPKPNAKTAATVWANQAVEIVKGFKSDLDLSKWHKENANTIARVRDLNEQGHKRLVDAISSKSAELSAVNA